MENNLIKELELAGKITPPKFVSDNICLLAIGGSYAYGVSTDLSDTDLIGVAVPPIEYVYPKKILGYDQIEKFDDYQQHHIFHNDIEYDIKLYSLQRLFFLAERGNPNILDFILSPPSCILFNNDIGKEILDFATNFVSKECIGRFFGFSFDHLRSAENRRKSGVYPEKRKMLWEKFSYDTKDISHCVRCLLNLEQILSCGTYQIDKNAIFIKQIREGLFTFEEAVEYIKSLELSISKIKEISTLREHPDHNLIRSKLVELFEKHWSKNVVNISI